MLVLDASAAAALLFREPDAARVARLLLAERRVRVPHLFSLEVANVARTKVRRGELDRRRARALLATMRGWPIDVVTAPWDRLWPLAFTHRLTIYDAAYLWLARRSRCRLLTLDDALATAAGTRALPR
jgi:predicted nucleic acid-binding protein